MWKQPTKNVLSLLLALLLLTSAPAAPVWAQSTWQNPDARAPLFSAAELENLLAPIALYPDPLLAQILPASTFVDQIDAAARFVRLFGVTSGIEVQNWDVSVKAVAHYPDVLFMMDRNSEWTMALGQAFVNQEAQVMEAIQRLRAEALAEGNLVTTPQQQVIVEGGMIRIVPAQPDLIFVPQYDPQLVYFEPPPPGSVFIFFGSGFLIGAWLNRDFHWNRHRIYYHGWQGGGWIGRARPHIHQRGNFYINRRFADIRRDRGVTRRDTSRFREQIRRERHPQRERILRTPIQRRPERPSAPLQRRPPVPVQKTPPIRVQKRPPARVERRPSTPVRKPPEQARPAPPVSRQPAPSESREFYRGRDLHQRQPSSQTGYGGYGSPRDAERYRERGRRSLENMQRIQRSAPKRQTAPARSGISRERSGRKPATPPAPRRERRSPKERDRIGR